MIIAKCPYDDFVTPEDTICLPISQAKKILIAASEKKSLDTLISILTQRINEKDSIISLLKQKDQNNQTIVSTLNDQKGIMNGQIDYLTKELKKQKRKKFWASVGGVVGIGAAFWLGLTL